MKNDIINDKDQKRISNELYVALIRYSKLVKKISDVKKYKQILSKFNELDLELKELQKMIKEK